MEGKMAAPHAIHEEFPHDAEIIHKLKVSDNHFARLLDEYDSLNDEVAAAETLVKPTAEDFEAQMRRRRVLLKDQIAQAIAAAKA
jgi:uncharacterized protein YdcH (DUF465 family)